MVSPHRLDEEAGESGITRLPAFGGRHRAYGIMAVATITVVGFLLAAGTLPPILGRSGPLFSGAILIENTNEKSAQGSRYGYTLWQQVPRFESLTVPGEAGQMVYDSSNQDLYVLTGNCGLAVIDTQTNTLRDNITLCSASGSGNGSPPVRSIGMILDPSNDQLFVEFLDRANLTVVNLETDTVSGALPIRSGVLEGAFVPATNSLYLLETYDSGSAINRVNATTGVLTGLGPSLSNLSGMYFVPAIGELITLETLWRGMWQTIVSFVDPASLRITGNVTVDTAAGSVGYQTEMAFDPATGRLFITQGSNNIAVVDVGQRRSLGNVSLGDFRQWAPFHGGTTLDSANGEVYDADQNYGLVIANGTTDSISGYVPLFSLFPVCGSQGGCPFTPSLSDYLAYAPSNGDLYVTLYNSDQIDVIPPGVVTFNEVGLPFGTNWSVTLGGLTEHSQTNYTTFTEPNGTYAFSIAEVNGQTSLDGSGSVYIHGLAIWVNVTFAPPHSSSIFWEELATLLGVSVVLALAVVVLAHRKHAGRKKTGEKLGEYL